MFEKFTDRARKVMQLANQEAQRHRHDYIGTEHILLGLTREGGGVAFKALQHLGIDATRIRLEVEKLVTPGSEMITIGKLPQTPRAKKAIERAMEAARDLGHNYVGTEHLLLGLIGGDSVAAQVLNDQGVTREKVIHAANMAATTTFFHSLTGAPQEIVDEKPKQYVLRIWEHDGSASGVIAKAFNEHEKFWITSILEQVHPSTQWEFVELK